MNTNNVYTPPQFAARMQEETLTKLREDGMVVKDISGFDALELDEPQYGEEVIGNLTDDEVMMFLAVHHAKKELDSYARIVLSDRLISSGHLVREGMEGKIAPEYFGTESQAHAYFKLESKFVFLREMFYWNVSERLECYDWVLRVRSKKRIIRYERKW